jgi:hypothetical protein
MVDQTHNRKQDWEGWPFGSLADAAEFVGELLAMIEEAAGSAPYFSATLTYQDRQYQAKSLDELREVAPALDLDSMHDLEAMLFWGADAPKPVDATFRLEGGTYRRTTRLRVSGAKGTAVDGVNVGAGAAVDRWAEKTRAAEEDRERTERERAAEKVHNTTDRESTAEEARERPASEPGHDSPEPAWQRFLAHPYSVQIIGGIVAGLIVLVIAVVVFSQN